MDFDNVKKEIVIFKLNYSCNTTNTYVLAMFFIDKYEHSVIKMISAISHQPEFSMSININSPWANIENIILDKKSASVISKDFISPFETKLNSIMNENMINAILLLEMGGNESITAQHIQNSILSQIGDQGSNVKIAFEKCMEADIETIREENKTKHENTENNEDSNDDNANGIVVGANFVLSPIYGKYVNDLEEGEIIMVRIHNNTESEKYINTLLDAVKGKVIMPVKAVVKKKIVNGLNDVTIIVEVFENIYAQINETEPIKVELFAKNVPPVKETNGFGIFIWILGSVLTLLAIASICYLFIL